MTVTTVRKIPSELPHAHLYLDDVEEICKILLDTFKTLPGNSQPNIRFSVGDNLRTDSIEDLEERGGSATHFSIEVGPRFSADDVNFRGFLNPEARFYGLSESEQWAVYSKLKAIFDLRRFVIKNAIVDLPGWLKWSLYFVAVFGVPPLLSYLHARSFMYIAYIVFLGLIAFAMFRPSRVSFVRSHDRSKHASEIRRGYFRDIFMIVLGGAIGKLIEYFAARWLK
jgi:hypothetical protein